MTKQPSYSLELISQRALLDFGFSPFFSKNVQHHADKITAARFSKKDGIKDLRHLLWSSMDNHDSQDLDQLEYCERRSNNIIHVKIAIADVDHFVKAGDPVDKHASHNATSLYTGVKNYPMLPENLSYGISSLLANEDRIAIIVEYNIKKDGQVVFGDIYQAWVCNHAKLIYEEAGIWLENPQTILPAWLTSPQLADQLKLQLEAMKRLKAYRQAQGMLEFETIEPKPIIEDGQIKEIIDMPRFVSHSIIEQFMIAANQTMVHFLEKNDFPTIQRVVRNPERWGKIVEIAQEYHVHLPNDPDASRLREFLLSRQKKSPDTFADLSLTIIKLLGRGEYELVLPGKKGHGHFGLAVGHYTHSTAPNRRYIDIIIQRLVKAVINKAPLPYAKRDLIELAAWCTERDTASKKAERFMRKVASAILLQRFIGKDFEGIITGSSNKGVYVRLFNPPAEGRIMRGQWGLDVGQKVLVKLTNLDPLNGFIDFTLVKRMK